jgi:hypothetical protein
MELALKINIDNDAFNGNEWQSEVIRCLKKVIDQIADEDRSWGAVIDINGNRVGEWDIDNNDEQGE